MSNILSLATRLRAMGSAELHRAMAGREIRPSAIRDVFDLAEALFERDSVHRALTRLDRPTLAVIAAVGRIAGSDISRASVEDVARHLSEHSDAAWDSGVIGRRAEHAAGLLLLERDEHGYGPYSPVDEQLRDWPNKGLPGLEELAAAAPPTVPARAPRVEGSAVDRLAAERAFGATTATAELLAELEHQPARELVKGGVCLPDTKRLAHAMAVDLSTVATFLAIASRAQLVAREGGSWLITELGVDWLLLSPGRRWYELACAWVSALPIGVRRVLGSRSHAVWGDDLQSYIAWYYPAGGDWMADRLSSCVREAELLGVTAGQTSSTPGALLLADDASAEQVMTRLFPKSVHTVYLQHDLSVVAPGPLAPPVDARLRGLADVDSRTIASSYRISTASINRALARGETAQSILAFLTEIAPTGIPQPLRYLIREASARHGLLRVGSLSDDRVPALPGRAARSYLRSDQVNLLETIRVDQNLPGLGLMWVAPDRLVSRLEPEVLFWTLSDARYPVAAENAEQEIVALTRRRTAKPSPQQQDDALHSLIERLKNEDTGPKDTGQAWLARRLEAAIREKATLSVSVAMPNGNVVDYVLEPAAVTRGRLRAHDRRAAIERTLPLSSIVSLTPATAS